MASFGETNVIENVLLLKNTDCRAEKDRYVVLVLCYEVSEGWSLYLAYKWKDEDDSNAQIRIFYIPYHGLHVIENITLFLSALSSTSLLYSKSTLKRIRIRYSVKLVV